MSLGRVCRITIFGVTVAILLFDLYLAAFGGPDATISLQLFGMTGGSAIGFQQRSLLICFGYLVGHVLGRLDA